MINELLEKYWEGESSLEQERVLREYFASDKVAEEHLQYAPLFSFFAVERESKIDISLEKALKESEETKVGKQRTIFRMPRYIFSVAASIALLICSVFIINDFNEINDISYVTVQGQVEDLESEEALQMAEEALLFLSGKLNKSSNKVKDNLRATKKGKLFK